MSDEEVTTAEETKSAPKKGGRRKASSSKAEEPKAPEPRPVASFPARKRTYTFEQWAKRRGIVSHHRGGMRAYVRDVRRSRTLEEWDDCFKDY